MKKKALRKLCALFLVGIVGMTNITPTYALDLETGESVATETSEDVVTEATVDTLSAKNARYGERTETTVINTQYKTITLTPDGQPEGGCKFATGGGFYVNPEQGVVKNFSVGLSWGLVEVSLCMGQVYSKPTVGGVFVNVPDSQHYYRVIINRTMKFERCRVVEYQYNEIKRSYYITRSSVAYDSYNTIKVR